MARGPVGGLCVNHQLLQKEASLMRTEGALIYGDGNSLGVSLIPYVFSRITVVDSPLGPMTSIAKGSWLQY